MASVNGLDELADLLIRAHEISEHVDNSHIKLLIEVAMYELGRQIALQSMQDKEPPKSDLN